MNCKMWCVRLREMINMWQREVAIIRLLAIPRRQGGWVCLSQPWMFRVSLPGAGADFSLPMWQTHFQSHSRCISPLTPQGLSKVSCEVLVLLKRPEAQWGCVWVFPSQSHTNTKAKRKPETNSPSLKDSKQREACCEPRWESSHVKTASSPIKVCSAACTSSSGFKASTCSCPSVTEPVESQSTLLNLAPFPKRTAPSRTQSGQIGSAREGDKAEEDSYRHHLSLENIRKQSRGGHWLQLSLCSKCGCLNLNWMCLGIFYKGSHLEGCRLLLSVMFYYWEEEGPQELQSPHT